MNGSFAKIAVTIILAATIPSLKASADLGFSPTDNATLRNSLMTELRSAQVDLVGTPLFFRLQELMLQIEAGASDKTDPYLWMDQVHEFCNVAENIYGPVPHHPKSKTLDKIFKARAHILKIRDFPLHEVSLNNTQATQDGDTKFYSEEQARAFNAATFGSDWQRRLDISEALKIPLTEGECQVIKVYSSGFMFRTCRSCMAIDLTYYRNFNTYDKIDEIVDAIDILFCTHPHDDHYDTRLWRDALQAGVPLVFAYDIQSGVPGTKYQWMKSNGGNIITDSGNPDCYDRIKGTVKSDVIQMKNGLNCHAAGVASKQGNAALILSYCETDGWSFYHTSDSDDHNYWGALKDIYEVADFLFCPQAAVELLSIAGSSTNTSGKPFFYFATHENEFMHSVSRRAAFSWLLSASGCMGGSSSSYPGFLVLMDSGESLIFKK
ncbi:MAG: hypothetical protein MJY62_04415 [Bacteroidales bacterium]|nr:hypothetical protein [Bacteroidales bacterium]